MVNRDETTHDRQRTAEYDVEIGYDPEIFQEAKELAEKALEKKEVNAVTGNNEIEVLEFQVGAGSSFIRVREKL